VETSLLRAVRAPHQHHQREDLRVPLVLVHHPLITHPSRYKMLSWLLAESHRLLKGLGTSIFLPVLLILVSPFQPRNLVFSMIEFLNKACRNSNAVSYLFVNFNINLFSSVQYIKMSSFTSISLSC
jgi:hypothetical protein